MASYSQLLARSGARPLALACALGWLAFGGLGLAIVLSVASAGGSLAGAGLAVGGFSAAAALLAPLRGRLVDRRGGRALVLFALVHTALLVLLAAAGAKGAPVGPLVALATLAGAVSPPLIARARALWPVISGPELRRTGHALNALLGDAGAVMGPASVGALTALFAAPVALAVLAAGPLGGALLVAGAGPGSAPPASPRRPPDRRLLASRGLRTMVLAATFLAVSLGAMEICAPALALRGGTTALAALPLGAFAGGAFLSSLRIGRASGGMDAGRLFLGGFLSLAAVLALSAAAQTLLAFTAVLAAAGACYAMLNVGLLELLDEVVPSDRATEGLTWITSAEGLGLAAGTAVAGRLADGSLEAALLLVALAPAVGAFIAWRGSPVSPG
jgi:MFS family permease